MNRMMKVLMVLAVLFVFTIPTTAEQTKPIRWEQPRCIDENTRTKKLSAQFFDGRLHVVHRGLKKDNIYHHYYTDHWHGEAIINKQSSNDTPTLATVGNCLMMFHTSGGEGGDTRIWKSKFNGTYWEDDTLLKGIQSDVQLAVTGIPEYNGAYFLYKGKDSSRLYISNFSSTDNRTIGNREIKDQKSDKTPTIVDWNGMLHHVHTGGSGNFWYSHSEGANWHIWSENYMIPGIKGEEPWLVVLDWKMYLFFLKENDKNKSTQLGYTSYIEDGMWTEPIYHDYNKQVNDVVIVVNPSDNKAHMVFVEKGTWKVFHTKQIVK